VIVHAHDDSRCIRPAASLLVLSSQPPYRVLMGRRPQSARFMPGVYVFPGGAIEADDARIRVAAGFSARDTELMKADDEIPARVLGVAAIRETFEETGLLCACNVMRSNFRWQDVLEDKVRIDLSQLSYLGRALTPAPSHIRFHARFFYVFAPCADPPVSATAELEEPRWVDLEDTQDLPIAQVTRFMLEEMRRRLTLSVAPAETPFYHRESGVFTVDYDHGMDTPPVRNPE
jgi:8-oxo-dGTP pyrophosphatase MutT (NUDIX family)